MNILISPSNNCSLAKTKTRILTQFGQKKKRQKQKYENNNFVLLPNIISHVITGFCQKKILLYVDEYFEIIFSLVWSQPVTRKEWIEGLKGLKNSILVLAFKF